MILKCHVLVSDIGLSRVCERYWRVRCVLQRVRQLKALCEELDSQVQDFEEMTRHFEESEKQWKNDK